MLELDNKFHEILYEASGSKELRHILSGFSPLRAARAQGDARRCRRERSNSNEEHRKIVEALKQHDRTRAEKLAEQHMRNTINNMINTIRNNLLKQYRCGRCHVR